MTSNANRSSENLILSEEMKKEKYLYQLPNGYWQLNFRCPARFGGQLIQVSTRTKNLKVAAKIRDRFVLPILALDSAEHALRLIAESIKQITGEATEQIASLHAIIAGNQDLTLEEAIQKYKIWMNDSSGLRPASIKKYSLALEQVADIIGPEKAVCTLGKTDAIALRDCLLDVEHDGKKAKGATTIDNIFATMRSFLRWLHRNGIIPHANLDQSFAIDLPPVRKVNTPIVPPSLADAVMNATPDWTLIPRIQRYTGMRIGEVEACIAGYQGCGIATVEGFRCFRIAKEFCKTHDDRLVPICDKLAPYLTRQILKEAAKSCAKFGPDGRRQESPAQKKYNRRIKKIPGCENLKDHSWRVYAQTMMLEAGVSESIVKRVIGHRDSANVHYGYTAGRLETIKKALDLIP